MANTKYPYAPVLFDYVRHAMPMTAPQSLTSEETYAVTAYLLHLNGLMPADAVANTANLTALRMPNRDGFIIDDRPDTQASRCMDNCRPFTTSLPMFGRPNEASRWRKETDRLRISAASS